MKHKIHSGYFYLGGLQLIVALHPATVNLAFHIWGEGQYAGSWVPQAAAFS